MRYIGKMLSQTVHIIGKPGEYGSGKKCEKPREGWGGEVVRFFRSSALTESLVKASFPSTEKFPWNFCRSIILGIRDFLREPILRLWKSFCSLWGFAVILRFSGRGFQIHNFTKNSVSRPTTMLLLLLLFLNETKWDRNTGTTSEKSIQSRVKHVNQCHSITVTSYLND